MMYLTPWGPCHTSERLCLARASLHSTALLCNLLSSAVDGELEHVRRYPTRPCAQTQQVAPLGLPWSWAV